MLHRLVREELGHEIEAAVTESEPIEDQRHRRRPHTDLLAVTGLLLVEPVGHADLASDLGDDAQMVEMFDDVV